MRPVGGIMRCDVIAEGIIKATKELHLEIPLIVRLQGTKEAEAKLCVSLCFRLLPAYMPTANFLDGEKRERAGRAAELTLCRMIRESGLQIYPFDGLDEAASKAVALARGE